VPAIAEKGYLDVRVDVHAPGGHSSIPPAHTSIGMLAQMLVAYEAHPYKATLQRGTPVYRSAQCLAAHAKDMPHSLKRALRRADKSDRALQKAEELLFKDTAFRALAGTTQAIDLVSGGVKTNALPEQAYAVVNHRIDTASSVAAVKKHDTHLLREFGAKFNLSVVAFGSRLSDADVPAYGALELSDAWGTALEPAPVTDTSAAPYKLLSGTIKAVYAAHRGGEPEEPIHVAPGIMSGNTGRSFSLVSVGATLMQRTQTRATTGSSRTTSSATTTTTRWGARRSAACIPSTSVSVWLSKRRRNTDVLHSDLG
jgi:Gly-Xaa carboxypeptidase